MKFCCIDHANMIASYGIQDMVEESVFAVRNGYKIQIGAVEFDIHDAYGSAVQDLIAANAYAIRNGSPVVQVPEALSGSFDGSHWCDEEDLEYDFEPDIDDSDPYQYGFHAEFEPIEMDFE